MREDIRGTALYVEAEALYKHFRQPGVEHISDAVELNASPDGKYAVFAGSILDQLEGKPPTRICLIDLENGHTSVLTSGPNDDRLPKYSPDGQKVAFLSDRSKLGNFQLYLLNLISGAVNPTVAVDGWIEYFHWSPNGACILLGVAGHGADIAGGQGAVPSKQLFGSYVPSWVPEVSRANESYRWRRAWVYDFTTGSARCVSDPGLNVWEAAWCGNDVIAAVISPGPEEGLWYRAGVHLININDGRSRSIYQPKYQLGWLCGAPLGRLLALVEAICSDRGIVAGDLVLIDTSSGTVESIHSHGIDVTYGEWRSDRQLLIAGHRGFEIAVGMYDVIDRSFREIWSSCDISVSSRYATVSGINRFGDCILVAESFARAPEIAAIRHGIYRTIHSFSSSDETPYESIRANERLVWRSPDGLEIQGRLLLPRSPGPYPLVMSLHGGPVFHSQPKWLGRSGVALLMLMRRGYAIFLPNPRGSSGRGQGFVQHVIGDIGGADTYDLISGLDHLIQRRVADPSRLCVIGQSYGGFMTAWLVTQDPRFAAAVSVAPITNHVSHRLLSNIPDFLQVFLDDTYTDPNGQYLERSPIMHVHNVKTPTLNICGALDRCTPPQEAIQFHRALLENGVESSLIVYPEEGHGIRSFPAAIDYAARVVAWFEEHVPASGHMQIS